MENNEIKQIYDKYVTHSKFMMGFPCNLDCDDILKNWIHLLTIRINNVGDIHTSSSNLNSKYIEKYIIDYFAKEFNATYMMDYYGYVGNGSTEGNMMGILSGKKKIPNGTVFFSDDTHYSVKKNCIFTDTKYKIIKSQYTGEIDYDDYKNNIDDYVVQNGIIFIGNIGTTFKGAIDDIDRIISISSKMNITNIYIHLDGALMGYVIQNTQNKFFIGKNFDSITISCHKFFGCTIPSNIFIMSDKKNLPINNYIKYISSYDNTICGSRSGHVPIYIDMFLKYKNVKNIINLCYENLNYIENILLNNNIPFFINPKSLIVVINNSNKIINDHSIKKFSLSCCDEYIHLVIMPHIDKKLINMFFEENNIKI